MSCKDQPYAQNSEDRAHVRIPIRYTSLLDRSFEISFTKGAHRRS